MFRRAWHYVSYGLGAHGLDVQGFRDQQLGVRGIHVFSLRVGVPCSGFKRLDFIRLWFRCLRSRY